MADLAFYLSTAPLTLHHIGWGAFMHSHFSISPEMFNQIKVCALLGPIKEVLIQDRSGHCDIHLSFNSESAPTFLPLTNIPNSMTLQPQHLTVGIILTSLCLVLSKHDISYSGQRIESLYQQIRKCCHSLYDVTFPRVSNNPTTHHSA